MVTPTFFNSRFLLRQGRARGGARPLFSSLTPFSKERVGRAAGIRAGGPRAHCEAVMKLLWAAVLLAFLPGCQVASIVLPDGARYERAALGMRLEVADVDVERVAPDGGRTRAKVGAVKSDAGEGMKAVAELGRAV